MGGKSSPPSAPDLTPISNAELQIAQQSDALAQQQLGISQQQFQYMQQQGNAELSLAQQQQAADLNYQQQALNTYNTTQATANQVAQEQLSGMQEEQGWAEQANQRYNQVAIPLQNQYIQAAQNYGSQGNQDLLASQAQADVAAQADQQTKAAQQSLASMGIDPSQIQSSSMVNQMATANAANEALAGNQSRLQTQQTGYNMLGNANNMLAGLPSQALGEQNSSGAQGSSAIASQQGALGSLGAASQFGGSGINLMEGALSNYGSLTGSPMQWASMGENSMGMSGNMYGNAASTENQQFSDQMSSWNAGQQQANNSLSTIGQVAGIAAMAMMAEGGDVDASIAQELGNANPYTAQTLGIGNTYGIGADNPMHSGWNMNSSGVNWTGAAQAATGLGKNQQHYDDSVHNVLRNNPNPQFHAEGGQIKPFKAQRVPAVNIPRAHAGAIPVRTQKPHEWMAGNGQQGGALPIPVKRAWAANPDTQRRPTPMAHLAEGGMPMPMQPNGQRQPTLWGNPQMRGRMFAEGGMPGISGGGGAAMPGTGNSSNGRYPMRQPISNGPVTAVPVPQSRDRIPAMLSHGEYVVPADVVRAVGINHLDKMVQKYHRAGA